MIRRRESGNALVETAFVLPIFFLVLFGFAWFAITLNNQMALSNATIAAAQTFATYASVGKGVTVGGVQNAGADPCLAMGKTFYHAGPGLIPSQLQFTINVATASDGQTPPTYTYTSVLSNAPGGSGLPSCSGTAVLQTEGYPVQIIVAYPCSLASFGFKFPCTLRAQAQYRSQ